MWALLTGGVIGTAWVAVVLLRRQHRLTEEHRELLEDRQRTLDELEALSNRMVEMQERLEFVERCQATLPNPERPITPSDTPEQGGILR